jgi:hypothetical protein
MGVPLAQGAPPSQWVHIVTFLGRLLTQVLGLRVHKDTGGKSKGTSQLLCPVIKLFVV